MIQDGDGPDPDTGELNWIQQDKETQDDPDDKVYIGKVPIMLRSEFCILDGLADKDQYELNECPYDKVCTP